MEPVYLWSPACLQYIAGHTGLLSSSSSEAVALQQVRLRICGAAHPAHPGRLAPCSKGAVGDTLVLHGERGASSSKDGALLQQVSSCSCGPADVAFGQQ